MEATTTTKPYEWENIDSILAEVAEEIEIGQVVGTEKLNLYDSMSALEIMDPKMDGSHNASAIHTLEEALQLKEVDNSSSLSESQVLGAFDQFLIYEMMWLEGYAATQTIFTCLYMHHPMKTLDDKFLASTGFSLLKRCIFVYSTIVSCDMYEDEDFSRHMCGLEFYDRDEKEILGLLSTAEESVVSSQKDLKALEQTPEIAQSLEIKNGLLARIRFARSWQQSLKALTEKNVVQAKKFLTTAKTQIELIASSTKLGEVPSHIFQQDISRRLEIPTHPRKVVMLTFEETISHFNKMIDHLLLLLNVFDLSKLDELRQFILYLVDDGAGALVRSLFMKFAVDNDKILGKYNMVDWLIKEAKEIAFVPDPFFKFPFVDAFLKQFSGVYLCYFSICSFNKARRRRRFPFIIKEFSALSELAYNCDTALAKQLHLQQERTPYFLLWVLDKAIDCMIHFLRIGFDLELYIDHEMKSIFWYMYQLAKTRKEQHFVLLRYDQHQIPEIQAALMKGKGGKVGKKAGKGTTGKAGSKAQHTVPTKHYTELSYDCSLYQSFFYYLQGLEADREPTKFNFGSPMTRYNDRFKEFFYMMSPPPYYYDLYTKLVKEECEGQTAETLLNAANSCVKETKSILDKLLAYTKSGTPLQKFQADSLKGDFKNLVTNGVNIYMILNKKTYSDATKHITYSYTDNFASLPVINLV